MSQKLTTLSKKYWYLPFYLFLGVLLIFYFLSPIDLTVIDLGRHLANGREILHGHWDVLFTYYYSYTSPNKKFVNHHWLFGLIMHLLEQLAGFSGIHLCYILLNLLTFFLFIKLIKNKSSHTIAIIIGLITPLLLSLRTEIRPEGFAYLFLIITLIILESVSKTKQITNKQIIFLLLQQLLWVNIHISFIFGIALFCLFWFTTSILNSPTVQKKSQGRLLTTTVGLTLTSFLNPNTYKGLMQPLLIFSDYGYRIVENQTLWFLWKVVAHPALIFYILIMIAVCLLLLISNSVLNWFERFLIFFGLILGFLALRNFPIMLFFVLPIIGKLGQRVTRRFLYNSPLSSKNSANILAHSVIKIRISRSSLILTLTQISIIVGTITVFGSANNPSFRHNKKLGLLPNQNQAAAFIKKAEINNPIFNNYDLGSYLIYHLHPDFPVFTDNRPEAYGKHFFSNIYVPMQKDEEEWEKQLDMYDFKTIIFGVRDITPWAQIFMEKISANREWQLAYSDQFIKIWTRQ